MRRAGPFLSPEASVRVLLTAGLRCSAARRTHARTHTLGRLGVDAQRRQVKSSMGTGRVSGSVFKNKRLSGRIFFSEILCIN